MSFLLRHITLKILKDKADELRYILPVDKGNILVVMEKLEYSESLFGDGSYSKVKNDPTLKSMRNLSQIFKKNNFMPNKYRKLTKHYTKLLHKYGSLRFTKLVFHWDI